MSAIFWLIVDMIINKNLRAVKKSVFPNNWSLFYTWSDTGSTFPLLRRRHRLPSTFLCSCSGWASECQLGHMRLLWCYERMSGPIRGELAPRLMRFDGLPVKSEIICWLKLWQNRCFHNSGWTCPSDTTIHLHACTSLMFLQLGLKLQCVM